MADGAAAKLVAFPHEHEIARGCRDNVGIRERGEQVRAQVQVDPGTRPDKCIQPGTHPARGRLRRLQLHQELTAQIIRIVLEEFLEVQDMRSEPRQGHRLHDRAYAPFAALGPGIDAGIVADDDLLAGVACAGPELL
jgi:hypothetical protein